MNRRVLVFLGFLFLALLALGATYQPGVQLIPPGTANAPGIGFTNANSTGVYGPSPGVWAVTTGGTERIRVDAGGHVESLGTAPTLGACGTAPALVGTDVAGKVTVGGTGAGLTSCAITFANAYTNAPPCTGVNETQILFTRAASTTTGLTFSTSTTMATGDVIAYQCLGRR